MESYIDKIDKNRLPEHIAIIMDGNGRWAKAQGLDRSYGHKKGVDTVRTITEAASELGIKYLTLYTFSTENWNRPQEEIDAFVDCVESGEKLVSHIDTNIITAQMMDAIYRSAEEHREIEL